MPFQSGFTTASDKLKKPRIIPAETRKLFLETMFVLIIAEMADALCGVIDAMYVGKFLGSDAMAAHGVSAPVFTFLCIFSYLLAAGIQHSCSLALSQGRPAEANGYFNMAVIIILVLSAVFTAIGIAAPEWVAAMLGSGGGDINLLAGQYLRGIAPGTAPLLLFLILVPILQIEGKWGLIHAGSIVMAVSDIALDYINIHYIHGGMFGMGMATSISYTLGLAVFLFYFADKDRRFRLRPNDIRGLSLPKFFAEGLPAGVRMVARMLSLVIINLLTINMAGAVAMAAIAIQRNISTVVISAVVGLCGAVLTLTSASYGKGDSEGIEDALRLGYRHSFGVVAIFATLLFFLASPIVSLYIPRADSSFSLAVKAVRWLAVSMPLLAWNWSFGSYLHGIGRISLSTGLFILGELIVQSFTATALGFAWGADGIFASFAVSQAIILLVLILYRPIFLVPLPKKKPE